MTKGRWCYWRCDWVYITYEFIFDLKTGICRDYAWDDEYVSNFSDIGCDSDFWDDLYGWEEEERAEDERMCQEYNDRIDEAERMFHTERLENHAELERLRQEQEEANREALLGQRLAQPRGTEVPDVSSEVCWKELVRERRSARQCAASRCGAARWLLRLRRSR